MVIQAPSRYRRGPAILLAVLAACSGGERSSRIDLPPVIPDAPAGVSAIGAVRENWLTWPSVAGATSYNVYFSTAPGVTTANGTRIAGVTSLYRHTGLAAGTPYYYVLTAVNAGGESDASSPVSATPVAAAGNRNVRISWAASHESGVNRPGGYYAVSTVAGSHQLVPYASGLLAPTFADTVLPSGTYDAAVWACQRLDSAGGTTRNSCSAATTFTLAVP